MVTKELTKVKTLKTVSNGKPNALLSASTEYQISDGHLAVQKTYKLYIGGKFPRTESGRYFQLLNKGKLIANVCRSSRKDNRNAVRAARATFSTDWAKRAPFNRGHIMYRIAEMLETRKLQFIADLVSLGESNADATNEVNTAIDRCIYYAGWSDKFHQIFSSVNPTNTPFFNFSQYEPMGVVAIIAPEELGLLGLISTVIPALVGGNTVIVLPSESKSSIGITFGEVLHTSDVSGGAVNVLTGFVSELAGQFASHMDINAVIYAGNDLEILKTIQENASLNVKRVIHYPNVNWLSEEGQNPYFILDTQEVKTTWHPVGY